MRVLPIIILVLVIILIILAIYLQVKDHYSQSDPMIQKLKGIIQEISPEAASKIRVYKGDKSYTINKRNVYLCLTDEKGEYYSMNTLVYVALHEIAHVLCESIGHTEEFDSIFKELLIKAEKMGYYDPNMKIPQDYCEY